jgi:hypothetical protein
MCLIIDANSAHTLFDDSVIGSFIRTALVNGDLKAAFGGRVKLELLGTRIKAIYVQFRLSGAFVEYDDADCDRAERLYAQHPRVRSDDPHVLGLADVSGCRLLLSDDTALRGDFGNKNVLPKPRGKILSASVPGYARRRLVQDAPKCRGCV